MISNAKNKKVTRPILLAACVVALAATFMVALSQPAQADNVTPPPVPGNIQVPAGNKLFFQGHAIGTQDYTCLPSGSGYAWTSVGRPQATLFDGDNEQLTTHFLSPNPDENGELRPTWQHSQDTSRVWARPIASSTDPAFVDPNAIPWLKLEKVGAAAGPTGDKLAATTFIQRVNTTGGKAPTTGCSAPGDVGSRKFVPYTADYYFYKQSGG